jgi:hypothetical protein
MTYHFKEKHHEKSTIRSITSSIIRSFSSLPTLRTVWLQDDAKRQNALRLW